MDEGNGRSKELSGLDNKNIYLLYRLDGI